MHPLSDREIIVRGAREHNLQSVDLTLPHGQMVCFTGVSGSGKSSLAFDTLYAEGQRRYLESLSSYARQFIGQLPKPNVDFVAGLSPSISISQKSSGSNPRSTVGTVTEIQDFLRVLYARVGTGFCPKCDVPIAAQTRDQIIGRIQSLAKSDSYAILAPLVRRQKGEYRDLFDDLRKQGYSRVRVDGTIHPLAEVPALERQLHHFIEVVLDRVDVATASRQRIAEAVESAIRLGQGTVMIVPLDRPASSQPREIKSRASSNSELVLSTDFSCPKCGLSFAPPSPQLMSFNSPLGMCTSCRGLGYLFTFDPLLLIPDPSKSVQSGAIALLGKLTSMSRWQRRQLQGVAASIERRNDLKPGTLLGTPWNQLDAQYQRAWLHGTGDQHITYTWRSGSRPIKFGGTFVGLIPQFLQQWNNSRNPMYRRVLEKYMVTLPCEECHGQRLNAQARSIRVRSTHAKFRSKPFRSLPEASELPLEDCLQFFQTLELNDSQRTIAGQALQEICSRLQFLLDVGLGYLTLARPAPSLSGGESQRIRLASQIGAGLVGVLYVLDEPSIGLHPRDNDRLLESLKRLRDLGNTLIVVEHDEDTMHAADQLVDFGPGPGVRGGNIVAQGSVSDILSSQESLTGGYLSGRLVVPQPDQRRSQSAGWLKIHKASHNNLRDLDVAFPLGNFICVTGVSGSGKSSLVTDILTPVLRHLLHGAESVAGPHERIEGVEQIDKIIDIDQSPIGRTPRSNPATYIKLFDEIRDLFSQLPDAKVRGFRPGRFSFNTPEGRCSACEGNGATRLDMEFLADVWGTCPVCQGSRYNRETLQVQFKEKTIADCLDMDVQQALKHFSELPKIREKLQTLHDVGLDYIKLGQPSPTLSGGEAQRIKLAKELSRRSTGRTLYVLDEPTTGLHFADVSMLLKVLQSLVDLGNTVIVIEHNLDIVQAADWIIDLGPEGGAGGGRIIATGTPEEVALNPHSHTGVALKKYFASRAAKISVSRTLKRGRSAKNTVEASLKKRKLPTPLSHLEVHGARQHNLQDLHAQFPLGAMTVFCGPSGSGKTSLAMDTIYAEGQRRYVESLSAYARQFIGQMPKPVVERVSGLSPAIALEQRSLGHSPRSTVGTITEIYDYLRLLMARLGQMHCTQCDRPVGTQTIDQIVDAIRSRRPGEKLLVLANLAIERTENIGDRLSQLKKGGYTRVRIDGMTYSLNRLPQLSRTAQHRIQVVIDRWTVDARDVTRLTESVAQALQLGEGLMQIAIQDDGRVEPLWEEKSYSLFLACHECGISFQAVTPHSFSFNSPLGWCPSCQGLGTQLGTDPAALIDFSKSIRQGGLLLWPSVETPVGAAYLTSFCEAHSICTDTVFAELPAHQRQMLLYGTGDRWYEANMGDQVFRFQYRGIYPSLDIAARLSPSLRSQLASFVDEVECSACGGSRIRPEAARTRFRGMTIGEMLNEPLSRLLANLRSWKLNRREKMIAGELLKEVMSRLEFLCDIGLDYLSLGRQAKTLSGGESQRIRLARQLGSGLCGVLYVLDEPTIGLHPRDNQRLIRALHRLRDLGNTLVVVEHDREVIAASDELCDFGPRAGKLGGQIVAHGPVKTLARSKHSVTVPYLTGTKAIPVPTQRRIANSSSGQARKRQEDGCDQRWLSIRGARANTLRSIDVSFPLGTFIAVTGPSGSGKSSLVNEVLFPALTGKLEGRSEADRRYSAIEGLHYIEKVVRVDQSALGNSPSSNPATYTGLFELIRQLYAQLPDARIRGYTQRQFSTNVPGGRCEKCEGNGQMKVEMHFLADVWVDCDACHGRRYTEETLSVQFKGKSIHDVLTMSVREALELFENFPKIRRILRTLCDVGLDYLALGQSAPTLSGGEAQRVRLAAELARPNTGQTFYLLDEPTTGLHFDDIANLLNVLHRLVDAGNTVLVIEHNLDVIKTADWMVDLGPEAGWNGGQVVAVGTPEDVVAYARSHPSVAVRRGDPKRSLKASSFSRENGTLRSYTGEALASVLSESPKEERKKQSRYELEEPRPGDLTIREVAKQSLAPWEADGRGWHLQESVDRKGKPIRWDRKLIQSIVDRIESYGWFAPINWNSRSVVEVSGPKKKDGWFMHAFTSETWLLKVKLRAPRHAVVKTDWERIVDLPTLNQLEDVHAYGNDARLKIRHASGFSEIEMRLNNLDEIDRPEFWSLFDRCAEAFANELGGTLALSAISADKKASRKKPVPPAGQNGSAASSRKNAERVASLAARRSNYDQQWHLSEEGFERTPTWKPADLRLLIELIETEMPKGAWEWQPAFMNRPMTARSASIRINSKLFDRIEIEVLGAPSTLVRRGIRAFGKAARLGMNELGQTELVIAWTSICDADLEAFRVFLSAWQSSISSPRKVRR